MKQELIAKYVLMSIGFVQLTMICYAVCYSIVINLV